MRTSSLIGVAALASFLLLAGCNSASDDNAPPPQATVADVATAVADASEASRTTHPLCELAQFGDVQAVVGGNIAKVDVIDDPMSHNLDCVYLDPSDLYNGLTVRFTTTEKLTRTGSQWANATAYVAEWSRGGTAVPGLGDAAAWIELPSGLLLQKGDYALHLSASRADLSQPEVRAKFEALARLVLERLP